VEAKVMEVNVGPTVTRYELSPGVGVKVSSISNLADDLALNLAAAGIRIEAPIPGKAAVGIEVPNKEAQPVYLREVVSDGKFRSFPSKLAFALGKDIAGNVVIADIAKMPHMLIAGSTGSGKSVCINTLVTSIIYKSTPEEVKLLMIDPKVVELKVYNGIPHLLIPVVTDPKKAAGALNWAVREMTARYDLFAETSVRDLKGFNLLRAENGEELIPQIVIIIDELADLMMTAGKEVEEYICRLAQMARAAGIHLIIATQRPSVDVITGLIKANIPSKIAFAVSSSIDSRTILGEGGAEKLLGRGDMLFYPTGMGKPLRVQGSFISDKEVEAVVNFVKRGATVNYDEEVIENITSAAAKSSSSAAGGEEDDEFMDAAIEFVVKKEKASASMLQRQFRIGYNRASRLIEIMEERGIVGPEDGSKPRKVLMSLFEWEGSFKS
jgi:S-DNA-T family DNA segregation ATPase FtsK/SpoIIIE